MQREMSPEDLANTGRLTTTGRTIRENDLSIAVGAVIHVTKYSKVILTLNLIPL